MKQVLLDSFQQALSLFELHYRDLGCPSIAFFGLRAADRNIFPSEVPISLVVSLDYGRDAELLNCQIPVLSLEKEKGFRRDWDMYEVSELLSSPFFSRFIRERFYRGSLLLPYASTVALEEFADVHGYPVFNNSESLRSHFEHKVTVTKIKEELHLPNASVVISAASLDFFHLKSLFGLPFVLQTGEGCSGSGTFIIEYEDQFVEFLSKCRTYQGSVVVAPFVDGPSLSVSGVITPTQNIFLPPAIQIAHNPETSRNRFSFSGVDFSAARFLPDLHLDRLHSHLQKIGTYMRSRGYLGAVNFDFMADRLLLTDINPRFMGSGHLITEIQTRNNEIPFGLLHLLTYLGASFRVSDRMIRKIWEPKDGSLIILHSLEENCKFVHGDVSVGECVFYDDACRVEPVSQGSPDTHYAYRFSIVAQVPQLGKVVQPDAPIARIHAPHAVLNENSFLLSSVYRSICSEVYKSFRFA